MFVVIMAGGGGTRLWPVSREAFPKQFAPLVGKKTLLQRTYERARAVVGSQERILVTTRASYLREVRRQLPRVPLKNILVERVKRDTAPSIGMAAALLAARGHHDEPLVLMPSDHLIQNEALFRLALRGMGKLLREQPDRTVLLGAEPIYPETGLGYIERGQRLGTVAGIPVCAVRRFTEKPTLAVAKRYLRTGRYAWNMGVYGWRVSLLLELFHRFQPAISRRLDRLQELCAHGATPAAIGRVYHGMPSISTDYALTERQDPGSIRVLPGAYGWSDVGHWASLAEVLGGRAAVERKRGVVMQIKAGENFVYHDLPGVLGIVGIRNAVIVATPHGVLVCDKAHTQDVKTLVAELQKEGHKKFL